MKTEGNIKEPLFHIVRRNDLKLWKKILIYSIAIATGLLIAALICGLTNKSGYSVFDTFLSIFSGIFGTERRFWIFLRETFLLIGVSLALIPVFKMRFWNLGGNGQILIGCLVCTAFMRSSAFEGWPEFLVIIIMCIASILAGAVWAVIPALFKAFFNTNESLFTLMMNYIAVGLVDVMITVWVPTGSGSLTTFSNFNLPTIGNEFLLTIITVSVLFVFMYYYLGKSKHGFELAIVGESRNTARYCGINVKKVIIRTVALSGAICGLIGLILAGSINHTVGTDSVYNMGFTAIMTTWLGGFNPVMIVASCLLVTFISQGMIQVRKNFQFTNDSLSNFILGLFYFLIIGCFFFINYRIVFRKKEKNVKEVE